MTKETKLQIEYQMVITDNKLAGKEIKNVANAVSDEALKVTTDATVTPNGPSITPNEVTRRKCTSYCRNQGCR